MPWGSWSLHSFTAILLHTLLLSHLGAKQKCLEKKAMDICFLQDDCLPFSPFRMVERRSIKMWCISFWAIIYWEPPACHACAQCRAGGPLLFQSPPCCPVLRPDWRVISTPYYVIISKNNTASRGLLHVITMLSTDLPTLSSSARMLKVLLKVVNPSKYIRTNLVLLYTSLYLYSSIFPRQ